MLVRLVIRLKQSESELPLTLRQKLANEVKLNRIPNEYTWVQLFTINMLHVTCYMLHITMLHVTCYMLHVNEYTWVQLLSYICTAFGMAVSCISVNLFLDHF